MKKWIALFPLLLALIPSFAQGGASSVVDTVHNLSVSGPNSYLPYKSTTETRVCIFCHTAHHSSNDPRLETNPLWSRPTSEAYYTPYSFSGAFAAQYAVRPGQPTGTSRLCLSCHDGTIALGNLFGGQALLGSMPRMTSTRPSYIGTDLTNDHPISFPYNASLFTRVPELNDPSQLAASGLKLERGTNFVQCTTCHDPHNNIYGNFLVVANTDGSILCTFCHNKSGWVANVHKVSSGGCETCHLPHGGDGKFFPPLLKASYAYSQIQPFFSTNFDLCLGCHPQPTAIVSGSPDPNFPPHYSHIVSYGIPCLACHPSHHASVVEFSPTLVDLGTYNPITKGCTNIICHGASGSHP